MLLDKLDKMFDLTASLATHDHKFWKFPTLPISLTEYVFVLDLFDISSVVEETISILDSSY